MARACLNTESALLEKQKDVKSVCFCMGISLREYLLTLRLKSELFDLRAGYAHTDVVGILPGEEMIRALSTTSEISTINIPSAK